MANYESYATVVLSVNGKKAKEMFRELEKDAERLGREIDKAARAGDKATMKQLQKELNSTKRMMDQLNGAAYSVENVLHRLDKATPKELNSALRRLKLELNGLERGTSAWDAHIVKIRAVKEELRRVNDTMRTQLGLTSGLKDCFDRVKISVLGVVGAVSGMFMAGRKAVDAYAEMEQEEANVRKFTGMSAQEVGTLNEEFKKMDTRSAREQLNRYAQEAGRLGKTTQEDVLGYVRAADKVNVALDDLGKGATLKLSKLAGIFGEESRLGTEKALLSIGSVINELSQNCSASAPYIAEFTSRVGGVGVQADMTVQQLMGYAAVLDSLEQPLEAASTALSQVIVRIYQNPSKYAKVAGMDVKRFTKLVKEDMNAALLELLSTLKTAGRMDVLSPMFKDMGETGSRAITTLSALTDKIDMVKSQQAEANKAFAEATSIGKEFDVQNNTVMAGLEKARKRLNERAVELGEKLHPVMSMVYSSSTVTLKVLSTMVDYFLKNRTAITVAAAAVAVYSAAVLAVSVRMKAYNALLLVGAKAQSAWSAVTRLGAVAAAAFRNSVDYLRNGLEVSYTMQERWRKAMAAMNWKLWTAGVLGAAAAVAYLCKVMSDTFSVQKVLNDVNKKANESIAEQKGRIDDLRRTMNDQNLTYAERIKAIKELEAIIPGYHAWLTREGEIINENTKAMEDYIDSLRKAARVEAAKAKLVELEKERLDIETDMEADKDFNYQRGAMSILASAGNPLQASAQYAAQSGIARGVNEAKLLGIRRKQEALEEMIAGEREKELAQDKERREKENAMMLKVNRELYKSNEEYRAEVDKWKEKLKRDRRKMSEAEANRNYNDGIFGLNQRFFGTAVKTVPEGGVYEPAGDSAPTPAEDIFREEKEWREKQEALARISYATGKSDYIAYTERMDEIAVEFYRRQLEHQELSALERLKLQADYDEAVAKQSKNRRKNSSDISASIENDYYFLETADAKQAYIDGIYSKETYDREIERLEIEHQANLVEVFEKGSDERAAAESRLADLLISQMERRQKETLALEAKFAAVKADYFGDNEQERKAKMYDELNILDQVYALEIGRAQNNADEKLRIEEAYQKARQAIIKKYQGGGDSGDSGSENSAVPEWLDGLTRGLSAFSSQMSAVFSQMSALTQAELDIQTAAINKRYDAEISRAEGNSYRVRQLEKQKEAEIAKAKSDANRKMFAMEVIQAVAQTATNALNAYGSAAAIPVVGHVLAPIAAAMAVAAGGIQIAAIKKQQQAAAATGYSEGGFTPAGPRDREVGVVHAGEWVASQRLVNNPRTRPLLEALDYAQRTNTIGSITREDVSRSVAAPMVLAARSQEPVVVNVPAPAPVVVREDSRSAEVLDRLADRLDEPFVTVNTVSGDKGIKKAQSDYDRLMKNKRPKLKK